MGLLLTILICLSMNLVIVQTNINCSLSRQYQKCEREKKGIKKVGSHLKQEEQYRSMHGDPLLIKRLFFVEDLITFVNHQVG